MVISISRLTTGTAVAEQAAENAAVQETNEDDTKLDVDVRTYAGQQDVSRQALERSEGVEDITYADLAAAYAAKLDSAIINQDGSAGTHLGIRSTAGIVAVTYTDASPTLAELYPKGADAAQQINGGIFTGATAWVMHSRRWGWFTAALDSSSRPFVVPDASGPFNPLAVGDAGEYGQVVGRWHGKPVVEDDNIPINLGAGTNEDVILGLRSPELILWEEGDGAPRRLKFEDVGGGSLTVKLVVYGYSAFTAGRYPKAAAVISGTGLVTPTF
jgi:HK97 family phage major capsid protein